MRRTTPPRPFDVTAVFPDLAPLARPAIRLHPRPGSPASHDSSVGGPLLWPADEPWPHCPESHEWHDPRTDEWHEGPNAMLPVAQLYVRDVPLLRPPGQADLLQLLWCPFEHEPDYKPPTALFWRSAAEVTDILAAPPETGAVEYEEYVPEPCVLAPEQITEYPNPMQLSKELQQQLGDWSRWQAAGAGVDSSYAPYPDSFYSEELSIAPGWKVGGWAPWGLTDPVVRFCTACEAEMFPLLTIASKEWHYRYLSWVPAEDQAIASVSHSGVVNSPRIQISGGNHLQLYVCPESPDHPHTDLIQ
ncbi:hypothetical protein CG724_17310 [Streptomyces sp. CB02120-2]|uniref:hypothetical protein n=2 Tax=Streptomyces TaxID=1883 RepID=UPI000C275BB8|nr:hypothetical protein [Streptomyces sp. CB02120-2]PJN17385.1 hypothetical protein CG724_17310 [Streptomyces sp. CB02120-2]